MRAVWIRFPAASITMNNPRVLVWAALLMLLFLNYQAWQHDYGPADTAAAAAAAVSAGP